jgi:hypothetical protein
MNPPLHPELRVRARSVRIKARYVAPLFRWKIMIHIHHTTIADGAPLHGAWVRSPDGWRDVYLYIRKDEDLGNLHEYLPLGLGIANELAMFWASWIRHNMISK